MDPAQCATKRQERLQLPDTTLGGGRDAEVEDSGGGKHQRETVTYCIARATLTNENS
jgi:hypothetical protein